MKDAQSWLAFLQGPLPIMIAFVTAAWLNNRRIDSVETSVNERIDDLRSEMTSLRAEVAASRTETNTILREIQSSLKEMDRRLTILEERSSPVARV